MNTLSIHWVLIGQAYQSIEVTSIGREVSLINQYYGTGPQPLGTGSAARRGGRQRVW